MGWSGRGQERIQGRGKGGTCLPPPLDIEGQLIALIQKCKSGKEKREEKKRGKGKKMKEKGENRGKIIFFKSLPYLSFFFNWCNHLIYENICFYSIPFALWKGKWILYNEALWVIWFNFSRGYVHRFLIIDNRWFNPEQLEGCIKINPFIEIGVWYSFPHPTKGIFFDVRSTMCASKMGRISWLCAK